MEENWLFLSFLLGRTCIGCIAIGPEAAVLGTGDREMSKGWFLRNHTPQSGGQSSRVLELDRMEPHVPSCGVGMLP